MLEFSFDGEVVIGQGAGAWHFIQLPHDLSDDLRRMVPGRRGRWGSIFPGEDNDFLLPVKADVRRAEDVSDGDLVEVILELL